MSIAGRYSVQATEHRAKLAAYEQRQSEYAATKAAEERQARIMATPSVSSEARSALQSAMARYAPGGGFGRGIEAGLERGRTQALSSGMQNLVSSGLAGTTMAGGLGKKYEEEVAAPARANLESIRAERISALQAMLAQMEQAGYQSKLGMRFGASESALGREFSASQAALNRAMSTGGRPSGGQPISANPFALAEQRFQHARELAELNAPRGPGAGMISRTRMTSSYNRGAGNFQTPFMQSATEVYTPAPSTPKIPGSYVGSMNGQRYIYSQTGSPVRE